MELKLSEKQKLLEESLICRKQLETSIEELLTFAYNYFFVKTAKYSDKFMVSVCTTQIRKFDSNFFVYCKLIFF